MGKKKKEALIQFNKENILSAAGKLFETKGIAATTMDEIAKEADCSKSTMYVYFKSKEDILKHIILEQMTHLKELILECMEREKEFTGCFIEICNKLAQYEEEHPVYYGLLLGEIKVTPEDIKEHTISGQIYEVGEEVNVLIEKLLRDGIEHGEVRSDIRIIETVCYLWSGISEIIRFAKAKQDYLNMRLGLGRKEYMEYACSLFIRSIEP